MSRKVIITCAVTGAIHTPSMSPHLPVTAKEIADAALGAAKAGAAIVHLHARNPVDGSPSQDPELFTPFLKEIKEKSNVVINLTTGGAPTMTIADRLRPAHHFKPEVASLNMGSMNFGLYDMLKRFKTFKHDWEVPYLANSDDRVFKNTFKDIAHILQSCSDNETRFEIECYDIGHLYTAAHFIDRGLIKAPFLIQSVFGLFHVKQRHKLCNDRIERFEYSRLIGLKFLTIQLCNHASWCDIEWSLYAWCGACYRKSHYAIPVAVLRF